MEKRTKKIIQKQGKYYSETERHSIIQEMLKNDWTKQYTWMLYTGEGEERGQLLRWMRKLGYVGKIEHKQYVSKRSIRTFELNSPAMSDKRSTDMDQDSFETMQLKNRIAELEKQLKDAEMKAIAYATMVDIAEKEFNIPIKKKFNTKPLGK
jgi:transposase